MENTENSLIYTYVFSIPASLGKYRQPAEVRNVDASNRSLVIHLSHGVRNLISKCEDTRKDG